MPDPDPQLSAISLKLDLILNRMTEQVSRTDSLELVMAAVLQALRHEQMPLLGTIIEKLEAILAAANAEASGGELATALKQLAVQIEALVEQDAKLTGAVMRFPVLVEEGILQATSGYGEAPPPPG